ncbi:WD repeat-containing protein 62 [Pseudocercospora fuligena]|uniref:WD repeat-containing protein 62 n=1 Tax=Pseudocercospora fuligena TaxID=685502 RepID=A0A8H6VLT4_9PEZI|nr:WD repeat-containing protein 62 [Pseudocercospora fuligena]
MSSFQSGALRLTPSHSPFFKSPVPRSPTKVSREEPGLHLKKVIGTTTASSNAFDSLPDRRKFVCVAGAAAVLATVDEELGVKQEFFRANPSTGGIVNVSRDNGGWPLTPTPGEARHRQLGNVKDNASPSTLTNRDWPDSPTGRTSSAKDRVKAATSVALSPNGKWLAVGETGYKPRVLIFSARDGSSEAPLCTLSEHTFGVMAVRFSPDSKYLASLGTVNDGFLYVWSIEERTGLASLYASNKCTSLIYSMAWCGKSIVTVGLRFVKVWRPEEEAFEVRERDRNAVTTPRQKHDSKYGDFGNSILSPKHRVLGGKNSLLGDLLEAVFISVLAISNSKALVCAESGEICLLDDSARTQTLTLVANAAMRISAARLDGQDMFHVVGEESQTASYLVPDLERRGADKTLRRASTSPTKSSQSGVRPAHTVAIATVGDAVVEINSDRVISLSKADLSLRASASESLPPRRLPAHQDAVLGVLPIQSGSLGDVAFLTFSGSGIVRFWNLDGNSTSGAVEMPVNDFSQTEGPLNELRAVALLANGQYIAGGDRYGTIALVELSTNKVHHHVRAHSAEIMDLLAFEKNQEQFVASASRDRTVQLFICRAGKLELLQTMDEHAGAVTGLLLSEDGHRLMSCSADRSIVVRECIQRDGANSATTAFAMARAITLKSAPTSICNTSQPDTILVSTVDRSIMKYNTSTGQAGFSFKCADGDGGEAVAMSKVLFAPSLNGNPTIAGVSGSDKSVRLYSDYGTLIARDWGHTEGITALALVGSRWTNAEASDNLSPTIVTVAADSTIFLWESMITTPRSTTQMSDEANGERAPPALGPPLRKVISHSEMSRMRRERLVDENMPPSASTPSHPPSPHKMRKKTSRLSLAQTPRLDPGFRPNFDPSRRRSMMQRSPSPPSPKHATKTGARGTKLGMSLRSKSSENVLSTSSSASTNKSFGTLNASTESVCRTLRTYRRKLGTASVTEEINTDAFRELEKELKLTARALGERSTSKTLDEATVAKLLDQMSDKMVGLLEKKFLQNSEVSSPASSQTLEVPVIEDRSEDRISRSDTAPGALESRRRDS